MSSQKKKAQVINQRIQKLQLQISGAKQQQVEPAEMAELEKALAAAKEQLKKLKGE